MQPFGPYQPGLQPDPRRQVMNLAFPQAVAPPTQPQPPMAMAEVNPALLRMRANEVSPQQAEALSLTGGPTAGAAPQLAATPKPGELNLNPYLIMAGAQAGGQVISSIMAAEEAATNRAMQEREARFGRAFSAEEGEKNRKFQMGESAKSRQEAKEQELRSREERGILGRGQAQVNLAAQRGNDIDRILGVLNRVFS